LNLQALVTVRRAKLLLIGSWICLGIAVLTTGRLTHVFSAGAGPNAQGHAQDGLAVGGTSAISDKQGYVGSESCRECHEDQFKSFGTTPHAKLLTDASWKAKVVGCESCHGPGKEHVDAAGDITKIQTLNPRFVTAKQISESCLACHAGHEAMTNFRRGEHWRNDVSCTECHVGHPHELKIARGAADTLNAKTISAHGITLLRDAEPQLCLRCHKELRAQFNMPFHHKVPEGQMNCSDCHNPHGGFETKQTNIALGADSACVKCHAEMHGPFAFEHPSVKLEGCTACHSPHGASNAKMLKRNNVNQMCIECHSNAHLPTTTTIAQPPNTTVSHDQLSMRYQNCTSCHVAIHGSQVDKLFLR
jgi:DmsE family decaheme c-type cytochrome